MDRSIVDEFKGSSENANECIEIEIEMINQRIVRRRGRREWTILCRRRRRRRDPEWTHDHCTAQGKADEALPDQLSELRQLRQPVVRSAQNARRTESRNELRVFQMSVIPVALSAKSVDVSNVSEMMDMMVILLKTKQSEDDSKRPYCIKSLDETESVSFSRSEYGTGGD